MAASGPLLPCTTWCSPEPCKARRHLLHLSLREASRTSGQKVKERVQPSFMMETGQSSARVIALTCPFPFPSSQGRLGGHIAGMHALPLRTWERTLAWCVIQKLRLPLGRGPLAVCTQRGAVADTPLGYDCLYTNFYIV